MPQAVIARQWLFLVAAFLVLGCGIGWNLYAEREAIDARERDRLASQARVVDENLGRQLLATNNTLDSICADLPFLRAQKNGKVLVDRRLQSMIGTMPGVRALFLLDSAGVTISSNRADIIGLNFSEREYFRAARTKRDPATLHVTPPYRNINGVFTMSLTKAILDERAEFAGVVVATLEPAYFNTLLGSVLYAPDMWTSLAHADGKVFLFLPDRPGTEGISLAQPGSFYTRHRDSGQMATVMTGTVYATGEERMMAQRTIKPAYVPMDNAILLAVSRDLPSIYGPWRREVYVLGGLFALLALIAGVSLFSYQRRKRAYADLVLQQEAERKQAEALLNANLRVSEYALTHTLNELLTKTLDEAELLTGSQIGFFHFLEADQKTLWLQNWSTHTLQNMCTAEGKMRHYPVDQAGVWVDCIRKRRPVMHNDYASLPHRKGLPRGHAPVSRELVIPIVRSENIVGIIGVGNKPGNYDQKDIENVSKLANHAWEIIAARRAEEALKRSRGLLVETERIGNVGGWEFDIDTKKQTWTEQIYRIHEVDPGYDPTVENGIKFYHSASRPIIERAVQRAIEHGESFDLDLEIVTAKGNLRNVHVIGRADLEYRRVYGFFQDITERKRMEEQVRQLAFHDALTQLPNRRLLNDRLLQAMAASKRSGRYGALMFLDLDQFKALNDDHGHDVGDLLLIEAAGRLKSCVREADTIARFGGDEFVVMVSELDVDKSESAAQARIIAEKIGAALAKPYVLTVQHGATEEATVVHQCTASIGVALFSKDEASQDDILRWADTAMYQAKSAGCNLIQFYDSKI